MDKCKFLNTVKGNLIVSCQALVEEPLHGSNTMAKLSFAAKLGGAVAIRANSKVDIIAIKEKTGLPTIGIIKQDYVGSDVFITPTLVEVKQLIESGTEVIALDATNRTRPNGETLAEIINYIRGNSDALIMGDISTVEEGVNAMNAGCDFISTTLSGYTEYSRQLEGMDFELIKELTLNNDFPVIAEGRIITPEDAIMAYKCGAHSVVVGTAITRPDAITARFANKIKTFHKEHEIVQ